MPVEVVQFCWKYNLIRLEELFREDSCVAKLRLGDSDKPYVTDNMNYIVDLYIFVEVELYRVSTFRAGFGVIE